MTTMRRCLTTALAFACFSAVVRADVTIVSTTTIEGGLAAMAGANAATTMTTRVKGLKQRIDVEGGPVSAVAIADLPAKQVIVLNAGDKTATVRAPDSIPPEALAAAAAVAGAVDVAVTSTGKSQVIDGVKCNEFKLTTAVNVSEALGRQMPPEAAAMLDGLKMVMNGSVWVAKEFPAAADYLAFQKASGAAELMALATGGPARGLPALDKVLKALASLDGLNYLSEIVITLEGSGQMADMMKQMGAMKLTIRTTSVKTDSLSDDLFKVPDGYTIVKQH